MRYVTFTLPNETTQQLGFVRDDRVIALRQPTSSQWEGPFPASLLELIQFGPGSWKRMAQFAQSRGSANSHALADVHLLSPIPRPAKNVFCLGLNYVSHMEESARARGREIKIPEVPVFFTKAPTSVNGPFDPIPWDTNVTKQVDYEAELGVVIGTTGKNIPASKALDHVFGYTIINDVSARDLQKDHLQWFKGKTLDGFCPMGPWIVTADEFGDPQTKNISLRVNGVTKQSSNTRHMIFTVAVTIESLSKGTTLEPGDIISTGTPEGVGLGRTPPEYLNDGDLVETDIEGIGIMKNRIVASK